jgi:hypothetical protein
VRETAGGEGEGEGERERLQGVLNALNGDEDDDTGGDAGGEGSSSRRPATAPEPAAARAGGGGGGSSAGGIGSAIGSRSSAGSEVREFLLRHTERGETEREGRQMIQTASISKASTRLYHLNRIIGSAATGIGGRSSARSEVRVRLQARAGSGVCVYVCV